MLCSPSARQRLKVFFQVDFDGLTESWCEICTVFLSCLIVRVKKCWSCKGSFSFDAFAGHAPSFVSVALFGKSKSFHTLLSPQLLTFCDSSTLTLLLYCIINNMAFSNKKCQPGVHGPI
jgi:hypothetical protein